MREKEWSLQVNLEDDVIQKYHDEINAINSQHVLLDLFVYWTLQSYEQANGILFPDLDVRTMNDTRSLGKMLIQALRPRISTCQFKYTLTRLCHSVGLLDDTNTLDSLCFPFAKSAKWFSYSWLL